MSHVEVCGESWECCAEVKASAAEVSGAKGKTTGRQPGLRQPQGSYRREAVPEAAGPADGVVILLYAGLHLETKIDPLHHVSLRLLVVFLHKICYEKI